MTLGALPYRPKFTAQTVDANGVFMITVEIRDANNVLKGSGVVHWAPTAESPQAIWDGAAALGASQMIADAGSNTALVNAIIATYPTKGGTAGDPAYVPDTITLVGASPLTWPSMPLALTEVPGTRVRLDLSLATSARFTANIMTVGTGTLALQYSTDSGTTWVYMDSVSGPSFVVTALGAVASGWVTLADTAKGDVLVRIVGSGGNGVLSPRFGLSLLQVR